MKKFLFLAAMVMMTMQACEKNDDRMVTFAQLPGNAQQFIKQYFASEKISYVKQDTGKFDGDYEVVFTDGKKVEFTKKGEWTDVECLMSEIPAGIVPERLNTYVNQNHAGQKIVDINRDRHDYEIKLSNGMELTFNLNGDFLRYDD